MDGWRSLHHIDKQMKYKAQHGYKAPLAANMLHCLLTYMYIVMKLMLVIRRHTKIIFTTFSVIIQSNTRTN